MTAIQPTKSYSYSTKLFTGRVVNIAFEHIILLGGPEDVDGHFVETSLTCRRTFSDMYMMSFRCMSRIFHGAALVATGRLLGIGFDTGFDRSYKSYALLCAF